MFFKQTFLLGLLLIITPLITLSQWEMASGLDGARIPSMVSIDSVLFAISKNRGVYSKSDTGNWELSYGNSTYYKLAKAGGCVFIYSSDFTSVCKRSFDYGATWESVSSLYDINQIWSIDTVIFFLLPSGLKRSFDFGTSYDSIQFPVQNPYITVLCDDSLLYSHIWDGYENHKIFYSDDFGDTWDSINSDGLFSQSYLIVKQLKYLNGTFWAQLMSLSAPYSSRHIFTYNNDLSKWFEVTNNLPMGTSHNDLFGYNGNILCSINTYPVFEFNDEDSSWVQFADASKNVNHFLLHEEELYCATDQGACSLDTNGNWTTFYTGLQHRDISSIATHNGNIYVTANNELFYSEDVGSSFIRNENAYGFQIITTDTVFYMISPHEYRMSWDEGDTWNLYSDSIGNRKLTHLSISPDYYYLGTSGGLFRSPSDSIAWEKVENGPFSSNFYVKNVEAIDTTVFAAELLYALRLYFSNDNGNSFSDYDEYCIFRKIDQSYYLFKDSIYYSDDLAQTWKFIPFIINYNGHCIDKKGDTLIIGGDVNGSAMIEMTYDHGEHWVDLIDDLPILQYVLFSVIIKPLKIMDGRLFVGNPRHGLWYRDDIITSTFEKPISNTADKFFIKVYPNPLSASSTIEYTLQHPSTVFISIYNQLGKQVDAINENQSSGKQQVIWNTQGLPSGIYYFTLQAGEQMASGKIVVVK